MDFYALEKTFYLGLNFYYLFCLRLPYPTSKLMIATGILEFRYLRLVIGTQQLPELWDNIPHHMAQPAKEKIPLAIKAFWECPTQDSALKWEKKKQQATLTIIGKMNVDLEDLL